MTEVRIARWPENWDADRIADEEAFERQIAEDMRREDAAWSRAAAEGRLERVTSRSRSIGYGWSNQPQRSPHRNPNTPAGTHYLAVPAPPTPDVVGSPREIAAAMDRAARVNSGNDWNSALFVRGRRIITKRLLVDAIWANVEDGIPFDFEVIVEGAAA